MPKECQKYKLKFVPSALDEWNKLDGSVKEYLRQHLKRRLDNPHVPSAALKGELKGFYKIKLRQQGYRLVYEVEDDALVVMVLVVDRRDSVYQTALARLTNLQKELQRESGPTNPAGMRNRPKPLRLVSLPRKKAQ